MFLPQDEIINQICNNRKKLAHAYLILLKNLLAENLELLLCASITGLKHFVGEFYHLGLEFGGEFLSGPFSEIFLEATKNSIAHGPENMHVEYGLFLGDKGICQGFMDSGDYFKSGEIRQIWESRIPIQGTKISYFSGYNAGSNIIYEHSDTIHVDTSQGVLYCVQSLERLKIISGKLYSKFVSQA